MLKTLFRFILSKTFIFGIFALGQIALIVMFINTIGAYTPQVYIGLTILSLIVGFVLFERDDLNPAYKMMWLFVFVLFPLISGAFYLALGRQRLSKTNQKRFEKTEQQVMENLPKDIDDLNAISKIDNQLMRCANYLENKAFAKVYTDSETKYFSTGEAFYQEFLDKISKAEKSIFMEYFIISDKGVMWAKTLEILKQRVKAGVDVRVIYDSFGCLFTLPQDYVKTLRSYGIKCYEFNAIKPSAHINDYLILNNRDHRKITVIDGEIGFSGGVNFSDEYINETHPFGVWKDTAFMVKGPATYGLTTVFLGMWAYLSGETPDFKSYLPKTRYIAEKSFYVQPYSDSPLDDENVSENAYFNIMSIATNYLYITTPYLIIDNEMLVNLQLAAKSGVDVRIILPGIPDKKLIFMLTQSYYKPLIQAGVKIYEYEKGFVHSKMYVSDDQVAIVGSANMDYRSLYLHFENCCAFYGGPIVKDVKQDMLETFDECKLITEDMLSNNPIRRIFCLALRVFAPLM